MQVWDGLVLTIKHLKLARISSRWEGGEFDQGSVGKFCPQETNQANHNAGKVGQRFDNCFLAAKRSFSTQFTSLTSEQSSGSPCSRHPFIGFDGRVNSSPYEDIAFSKNGSTDFTEYVTAVTLETRIQSQVPDMQGIEGKGQRVHLQPSSTAKTAHILVDQRHDIIPPDSREMPRLSLDWHHTSKAGS